MKYYEVLKGNVGGFGNKIHKKGSTVTDAMFPTGNAKTLEKMGFLKSVEDSKKAEEAKAAEVTEEAKAELLKLKEAEEAKAAEVTESNAVFVTADGVEVNELDDCTKQEIMDQLKLKGIDFDPADKKNILFDLLKA